MSLHPDPLWIIYFNCTTSVDVVSKYRQIEGPETGISVYRCEIISFISPGSVNDSSEDVDACSHELVATGFKDIKQQRPYSCDALPGTLQLFLVRTIEFSLYPSVEGLVTFYLPHIDHV